MSNHARTLRHILRPKENIAVIQISNNDINLETTLQDLCSICLVIGVETDI